METAAATGPGGRRRPAAGPSTAAATAGRARRLTTAAPRAAGSQARRTAWAIGAPGEEVAPAGQADGLLGRVVEARQLPGQGRRRAGGHGHARAPGGPAATRPQAAPLQPDSRSGATAAPWRTASGPADEP